MGGRAMELISDRAAAGAAVAGDAPHLLLVHGASQPVTSVFFETLATGLTSRGVHVHRFEFGYMAARRASSKRGPPPRIEKLLPEFREAIALCRQRIGDAALWIGGKSMGGRAASLIADDLFAQDAIAGLIAVSYPFHPVGKPDKLRTAHLQGLVCPALIVQGERDPFGTPHEVSGYGLSDAIRLHWCVDGDHDLKPRKKSGTTWDANLNGAAAEMAAFALADRG